MSTPDFFRSRIDAMINLGDPLAGGAGHAAAVGATRSGACRQVCPPRERSGTVVESHDLFGPTQVLTGAGTSPAGRPRLPLRLMLSLLYPKHAFNLRDEELVLRWSENVLWQFFSGYANFEHRLPCDATQIGHFRRALGEDGLEELLKAAINTAVTILAVQPQDRHEQPVVTS